MIIAYRGFDVPHGLVMGFFDLIRESVVLVYITKHTKYPALREEASHAKALACITFMPDIFVPTYVIYRS